MRFPNIFFSGFAGSGKSFCVRYLQNKHDAKLAKWAYPVYGIAEDWFGMKQKDRALLQLIGTDVGRQKINPDIWVNRFKEDVQIVEEVYFQKFGIKPLFVSDDTRFVNEVRTLQDLGWVGIWLDVSYDIRKARLIKRDGSAQEETLNHISETGMNEFKHELIQLEASGSLEETYNNLEVVLDKLKTPINK